MLTEALVTAGPTVSGPEETEFPVFLSVSSTPTYACPPRPCHVPETSTKPQLGSTLAEALTAFLGDGPAGPISRREQGPPPTPSSHFLWLRLPRSLRRIS